MTSHEPDTAGTGDSSPASRCGYITLLGAPNVGKSTLLNALVGQELSIVSSKRQTTWQRVTGILTSGSNQLIFLDTPGIVVPEGLLHRSLLRSVKDAVREADIIVIVLDSRMPLSLTERERLSEMLSQAGAPRIGVVNKVDAAKPRAVEAERSWLQGQGILDVHLVSARSGTGLAGLLEELSHQLPLGPFLYPEDEVASAPERFFVAEIVRQAIFEQFHEELPYSSICKVEEFRRGGERSYVQVTVYVERPSQKGILIGEGGQAVRRLGIAARRRMEHFLERPVYLDLWVKVLPNWRNKPEQLRRLGLPVPQEHRER